MEGTCNYKECAFFKRMKWKHNSECFNFIETWWTPLEGTPKLVQDCAPKRTMIMTQELYNQQIRLQQASEEQRNEFFTLKDDLGKSRLEYKRVGDVLQGITAVLRRRLAIEDKNF